MLRFKTSIYDVCGDTIQLIILREAQGPVNHLAIPPISGGRGDKTDLVEGAHQRHWLCLYCGKFSHSESEGTACLPQLGNVTTHAEKRRRKILIPIVYESYTSARALLALSITKSCK